MVAGTTVLSARLSAVFGVNADALTAICARLAKAVERQAAMDTVRDVHTGRFEFTFGIGLGDPHASKVPHVLYGLNCKGLLRTSRAEWIEMFARACCVGGSVRTFAIRHSERWLGVPGGFVSHSGP